MSSELVREFKIEECKKEDFLIDLCTQLATQKVNDNKSVTGIITNAKLKMSQKLSKLRGKKVDSKDLKNFKLDKRDSISRIACQFCQSVTRDLKSGEGYRFRQVTYGKKIRKGEYAEIKEYLGVLYVKVFKE